MDIIVKRRGGFTLAEVLITLSIIGVVAALTIPGLVVKNQEKETVVRLKKVYNVFSNAFTLAEIEYGGAQGWGWGTSNNGADAIVAMNKLTPFLNIMKNCANQKGCWSSDTYKYLDGTDRGIIDTGTTSARGLLADGTSFRLATNGNNCNNPQLDSANNPLPYERLNYRCGTLEVDLNSFKKPNTVGKDVFSFWISAFGIIPKGTSEDFNSPLASQCKGGRGDGCTAWVLIKENMDYPPNGTGWD